MAGLEVQIASDLHIEFMDSAEEAFAATFGAPPVVKSQVLALLGDIGVVREAALFAFLLLCTRHWRHVLFLKGNHELYQTRKLRDVITIEEADEMMVRFVDATNAELEAAAGEAGAAAAAAAAAAAGGAFADGIRHLSSTSGRSITYLNGGSAVVIDGVRVIGATLWSFIPPAASYRVASMLNDYSLIATSEGFEAAAAAAADMDGGAAVAAAAAAAVSADGSSVGVPADAVLPGDFEGWSRGGKPFRLITPADTAAWHAEDVAAIGRQLAAAKAAGQPALVLTHHAPLVKGTSDPQFDKSPIGSAFAADLRHLFTDTTGVPTTGGRAAKRRRHNHPSEEPEDDAAGSAALRYTGAIYADNPTYEYLDHTADVQIHSWGATLADALAQNALGMFGYMTEPDTVEIDPACSRVIEARGHDLVSLVFSFMDACLYAFASDDFIVKDMRVVALACPGGEDATTATTTTAAAAAGGAAAAAPPAAPASAASAATASSSSSSDAAAAAPAASSSSSSSGAGRGVSEGPYHIKVECFGERWNASKHPQGTEVKAMTYSNMQILTPTQGTLTANADEGEKGAAAVVAAAAPAAPAATAAAASGGDAAAAEATAAPAVDSDTVGGGYGVAGRPRGVFDVYVIVDI